MTCDMWHVTRDTWHLTPDMWHMTCDMWHVVGGEHCLKISAPQLLRFVIYDILKIWRKRLTHWLNESVNDEGVYRTAPATPGLLNTFWPWGKKEQGAGDPLMKKGTWLNPIYCTIQLLYCANK